MMNERRARGLVWCGWHPHPGHNAKRSLEGSRHGGFVICGVFGMAFGAMAIIAAATPLMTSGAAILARPRPIAFLLQNNAPFVTSRSSSSSKHTPATVPLSVHRPSDESFDKQLAGTNGVRSVLKQNGADFFAIQDQGRGTLTKERKDNTGIHNEFTVISESLISRLNLPPHTAIMQRPKIVGHRGSVYQALENTLYGFQLSSQIGCDAVELDVFLLKCGNLVVFHGSGTDETPGHLLEYCGIDGSILDYTATEARYLPFNPFFEEFGCGAEKILNATELGRVYIPTLEEVLLNLRDTTDLIIKIELKGPGTEVPALELVERLGMIDRCHFSSFDHGRVGRIRSLRPDLRSDGTHRYRTGALFSSDVPPDFVEIALSHGASEVHLKYDTCTPERIHAIHEAGMDSMAWFRGPRGMKEDVSIRYYDVDDEDEEMYKAVLATGVMAMCVNKPDILVNMVNKYNDSGIIMGYVRFT